MATKKLRLNRAYSRKDGTYPLVVQLLHRRKKRVINTNIYLRPDEFDEKKGKIISPHESKRTTKEIKNLNNSIITTYTILEEIVTNLNHSGKEYSVHDIVEAYMRLNQSGSLYRYWSHKIERLKQDGRHGMSAAQQSTLRSVTRYFGSVGINFSKVTTDFVNAYESHLLSKGVSPNTACFYMRNFKSLLNSAVKDGAITALRTDPFVAVESNPKKTIKRALSRDNLRALSSMNFENEPELELSRDLFLFSFYTRGMAFVDIAFLQHKQIAHSEIRYSRRKTGQTLRIGVSEPIGALILKYLSESPYLFPIVVSNDKTEGYKEYRSALRRINKYLKIIQQRLGITVPLTTYVARHSWATQAKEHGFPISVISEGLGHTSEKITQIYLKEFDQSVLDKANDIIIRL